MDIFNINQIVMDHDFSASGISIEEEELDLDRAGTSSSDNRLTIVTSNLEFEPDSVRQLQEIYPAQAVVSYGEALNGHRLLQHGVTQKFACFSPNCAFRTGYWCELACHESSHQNHGSNVCTHVGCSYTCNSLTVMKDHLQRRHAEARLRCGCGTAFQDVTSYQIHMRYCPFENAEKLAKQNGSLPGSTNVNWEAPVTATNSKVFGDSGNKRHMRRSSYFTKGAHAAGARCSIPAAHSFLNSALFHITTVKGTLRTASQTVTGTNSSPSFPDHDSHRETEPPLTPHGRHTTGSVLPPKYPYVLGKSTLLAQNPALMHPNISNDDDLDRGLMGCKLEPEDDDWDVTDTFSDIPLWELTDPEAGEIVYSGLDQLDVRY